MPIRTPSYPGSVRTAAAAIIRERIAGERGEGRARRDGNILILPVYGVPIRSLAKGTLQPSTLTGWRVVWIEERRRVGATLEFQRTKGGRPKFCTWSFGAKAFDTAQALLALSKSPAAFDAICRPSILKVSALQIEAIWLRGPKGFDAIFDLETRLPLDDFRERVAEKAKVTRPRRRLKS